MTVIRGADNVVGVPGALDPSARAFIDATSSLPPIETLSPDEARHLPLVLVAAPPAVGSVTQRWVAGPGGPLAIRIYRPVGIARPPALVYLHGGGWVIGSLEGSDTLCRRLTNAAGCAVFSVEYRLAPEHKYPAALDDTLAAIASVVAASDELAIDGERLVVGGVSAGANLAAAASLVARDRGGPRIALQVLLVPPLWMARDATESARVNGRGYGLETSTMRWFAEHYVRTPDDALDPLVSPYLAKDLQGLPPAIVVTAEYDPLRDDGELYAGRLRGAGSRRPSSGTRACRTA